MSVVPRKIGTKTLHVFLEMFGLNKWVERPACTEDSYPLKGALSKSDGAIIVAKNAKEAIGFLGVNSNDVQHSNTVFLLSSVYGRGYGLPVLAVNYVKCMLIWCVRKIVVSTWTNNRDQFKQPTAELPEDFITDCAVWDLFHSSNQTSSLKDVEYKGTTYQVRNQFFPYLLSELREWDTPHDLSGQLRTAQDTFVANWLKGRALSAEAQTLLDAGRKVYQVFYKEWKNLNLRKFKIDYYDCGWYQIRNALLDAKVGLEELNAVKEAHTKLALKLRPKVYDYGFLDHQ